MNWVSEAVCWKGGKGRWKEGEGERKGRKREI